MTESVWSARTAAPARTGALSIGLTLVVLTWIACSPVGADQAGLPAPVVVGWAEKVCLHPGEFTIPAKVDTGAVSCCLHAADPERYSRDGQDWVRFRIKDCDGRERTVDRQIVGTKRIKRHFGGFQDRPIIRLGVCLGSIYKEVDVNLVDRTGFEYPMLIGRNFMEGSLVVNPSARHATEPACPPGISSYADRQ